MTQRTQMKILLDLSNQFFIGRIQPLISSDLPQQLKLLKGVNTS